MYTIATDGACRGNPGPGAWAFAVFEGNKFIGSKSGFEPQTTNNEMELRALVELLGWVVDHDIKVEKVKVDSSYCINGVNSWLKSWKAKGWKNSRGETVKNLGLWYKLDQLLVLTRGLNLVHVKGHSGDLHNEKADKLCNEQLDKNLS